MIKIMTKQIIAIDADGVMLDYNLAYARAWERTFGVHPVEINPDAYWATERWDVKQLTGADLVNFRSSFDEEFWTTVPMLEGVFEACDLLHKAGYELVCVTAIDDEHRDYRHQNLLGHGLPIDRVISVGNSHHVAGQSPKATALAELKPVAFVDDYLPYFKGVDTSIHKALIMRTSSSKHPNQGEDLNTINTQHPNLLDFSKFWLKL